MGRKNKRSDRARDMQEAIMADRPRRKGRQYKNQDIVLAAPAAAGSVRSFEIEKPSHAAGETVS